MKVELFKLQKFVQAFAVTYNIANVVNFFTQSCCDSKSFFDDGSSITKAEASSKLLDIINVICNWNSNDADENCIAAITQFEADAIEYLGGFVLYKAKSKFAFASSIVEIMTKPTPTEKLVKALEKKIKVDFTIEMRVLFCCLTLCILNVVVKHSGQGIK